MIEESVYKHHWAGWLPVLVANTTQSGFHPFVAKYGYPHVVNGKWRRSDTLTLIHKPNVQSSVAMICL